MNSYWYCFFIISCGWLCLIMIGFFVLVWFWNVVFGLSSVILLRLLGVSRMLLMLIVFFGLNWVVIWVLRVVFSGVLMCC